MTQVDNLKIQFSGLESQIIDLKSQFGGLEGRIMDILINQSKTTTHLDNNNKVLLHIQDRINIQGSEYKTLVKELAEQKLMIMTQDTKITSAVRTMRFFLPSILIGCLSLVGYFYTRNEAMNMQQNEKIMQLQLSDVKHFDRLNNMDDRILKMELQNGKSTKLN